MISCNCSLAFLGCSSTVGDLLGLSLNEEVLVEFSRNCGFGAVDASEVFVVHIIHDVIGAVLEPAQLDRAAPVAGEERIVHFFVFADNVSLGAIKADIVKVSEILSSRKHFFFINLEPFLKDLLALWCQVGCAVLLDQIREYELGTHNSANSHSGSEVNRSITQFDVVAKVRDVIAHESFQSFAFGANLKRTFGIGRHRHIEMWHGEKRVSRTARTKLY